MSKKVLILSEVDILYSEKNKIHWLIEGLEKASIPFHIYSFRDTSKNIIKHTNKNWPITYINTEKENPALVDAFPRKFFKRLQQQLSKEEYGMIFAYNTLRFGSYFAEKMKLPLIYDLSDDLAHMAASSPHIPSFAASFVEKVAAHYISKSIHQSHGVTVTTPLLFRKFSQEEEKIILVPNGFQWSQEETSISLTKPHNEKWVVFVGALREWVCLEEVISEMPSWPENMRLVIIGTEGKLEALKKLSKEKNVYERILWLGHIPHQELPPYLRLCDVGIIPFKSNATTEYSFPLKLVEYLSMNLSVVSTDLTFVKEKFGQNIIIKNKDEIWLYSLEKALQKEYIQISQNVLQNYSWKKIQKQFSDLLQSNLY